MDNFTNLPKGIADSRTILQTVFATTSEAIAISDAEGRLIWFNDAFVRYHRFRDRDECSRSMTDCAKCLDVWFADGTPAPLEQLAMPRALRDETASNVEYRLRHKETGQTWWGSYNFAPIKDDDGNITGAVVAAREITECKQAELEREQASRLLVAISQAQTGFNVAQDQFGLLDKCLASLLAVTDSEYGFIGELFYTSDRQPYLTALSITDVAWSDESRKVYQQFVTGSLTFTNPYTLFGEVMTTGKPVIANDAQDKSRRKDVPPGHPALRTFLGLPLYSSAKELVGTIGLANRPGGYREEDIAFLEPLLVGCANLIEAKKNDRRRQQTESALRASEERFALSMEATNDGLWDWDPKTDECYFSPANYRILGYETDEFPSTGQAWKELIHPEDLEHTMRSKMDCVEGRCDSFAVDYRIKTKNGEWRWILCRGKCITRDAQGRAVRLIGTHVDITERKEELRVSEERLALAISGTQIGMYEWDVKSGKTFWTEQLQHLLGLPTITTTNNITLSREHTYRDWADRVHPEDLPEVEAELAHSLKELTPYEGEYRVLWPDGTLHWVMGRGTVIADKLGKPERMLGIVMDITGRKLAEEAVRSLNEELEQRVAERAAELRERDRLMLLQNRQAAMGEMLGNIAHQWRQPLNNLGLYIQQLSLLYEFGELTKDTLDENVLKSMNLIHHMSRTIDDFRNYFKPNKEKGVFDVKMTWQKTLSLMAGMLQDPKINVEIIANDDVSIYGYQNEFVQVALNILANSRDAFIQRNTKDPTIAIKICTENNHVVITIADNAGGIPEKIIGRVFDPYFTTKGPQQGTGIGLFMSKTIIEKNMNGRLTVRNSHKGAEFRIEV